MRRVIAKKHVDSKATIWIAAVFFLLASLGVGAVIFASVAENYHYHLVSYRSGFEEQMPTPPYGAYILVVILSVGIGALLFWLMFFVRKIQMESGDDVIIYDEESGVFSILVGKRYVNVPLKNILKTKIHNMLLVYSGSVPIPLVTSHGRVTFKYVVDGKKHYVTSNYVTSIKTVATELEEITKKGMRFGF